MYLQNDVILGYFVATTKFDFYYCTYICLYMQMHYFKLLIKYTVCIKIVKDRQAFMTV